MKRFCLILFALCWSPLFAVSIALKDLAQTGAGTGNAVVWDGAKWAPGSPSAAVAWGAITGTLASQTDLINALNLKAPLANPTFTGTVTGTFTGNLTGNVTGTSGSTTGNAATATALQTARTINGTSFNGTANITVTAAASTLTGAGTGVTTFLVTPSSANLIAALTDETGTGSAVFSVSPALTGTPTVPTATPGDSTTTAASTAFVATSFAPLASPALTGTPTAPTASAATSTTQLATTAFVTTADNLKANSASPTFTGTVTGAVTGSAGQNVIVTASNVATGTNFETFDTTTGATTFTPNARTGTVGQFLTLTTPADTALTAATEAVGIGKTTAIRQWAAGTVALQREINLPGVTLAGVAANATFTDATTLYLTAPTAGTNGVITRPHSALIVGANSASSSIAGELVISAVVGTTATSVGIGNGNVNAGGLVTGGTITSTGAFTASSTSTFTGTMTSNNAATFNGTNATTALTVTQTARTSGILPYLKINIPADLAQTASTESPGILTVTNTRTFAAGTVAAQREYRFVAPTYAGTAATATFTKANTFSISGAPIQGTNAVITEANAFEVEAGNAKLTGGVQVGSTGTKITGIRVGTSGAMTAGSITVADTATTANTRYTFTARTLGTITLPTSYYASARSAGVSFTIVSAQITDTSTVDWVAYEP